MSKSFDNGKVLVVADDLTGSNDAAVQFAKAGLKTITLLESGGFQGPLPIAAGTKVLAVSTESRNIDAQVAQEAVRSVFSRAFRAFRARTVFKKIDSTLRGNIEAELMALIDARGAGSSTPVIFSPAYPSNGRTVSGGYVLVDGVPLCLTFAAQDALAPVRSSQVTAVFTKWRDRVGNIHFSVLEKGEESVRAEVKCLMASGKSVIVSDALTDEDLLLLVRSVRSLGLSPIWAGSAGLAWAPAQTVSGFTSASSKDLPASFEPDRPSACGPQSSGGPRAADRRSGAGSLRDRLRTSAKPRRVRKSEQGGRGSFLRVH